MTARDFAYWLQGFFEITAASGSAEPGLNPAQTQIVQRHLALVFVHDLDPATAAEKLQQAHDGLSDPPKPPPRPGGGGAGGGTQYRC